MIARTSGMVLCALSALTGPLLAQQPTLRLAAGSDEASIEGRLIDGAAAYPITAFELLGGRVRADGDDVQVVFGTDTLVFAVGSPFVRAAGAVRPLAFPARRVDGAVYLPEQVFLELLPAQSSQLSWRAGALRLAADALPGRRLPIERVVVIDPGHGGRDPGKVGPGRLAEKDVVLAIGHRLAGLLAARGYEVHMTRDRDTLIALADRPRLANQWKGERQRALFLSIHANSWQSSVRGFETFFLSDARTEDARRVAEMENAAQAYEDEPASGVSEAELIMNALRNDFYVRASNDLAEVVQAALAEFHPGPNRGVKQAGFVVLIGAFMPAVLIETAFISNREEARLLSTDAFQQKLAHGIADAVDRFFVEHEHLWSRQAR